MIIDRTHFRKIYSSASSEHSALDAGARLFGPVKEKFGEDQVRFDTYRQSSNSTDFPVLIDGGLVKSSLELSDVLVKIPLTAVDFIFCAKEISDEARRWIEANQVDILQPGRTK